MGYFKFSERVKILPGVHVNFAKHGVSLSIGEPGASFNIGRRGTRITAGIPGTGISYIKQTPFNWSSPRACLWFAVRLASGPLLSVIKRIADMFTAAACETKLRRRQGEVAVQPLNLLFA